MTLTPADLSAAEQALAEYNEAFERREEMPYPHWAEEILKRANHAEQ